MEEIKQNKMGTMPCNQLLLTMSVPMMLSMLVQALYNIVDSIFVARLSEDALTAVSLAFPVQTLIIAVVGGTGVGINARLSRKLGERRFEEVHITAGNALLINFIYTAVIMIIGQFAASAYFRMMTPDAEIRAYGTDYLYVIMTLVGALIFQVTFERLLQSTGLTIWSMISQTVGAVTNIILDPIMIFGLLGCPRMGVSGAAIATVVGQFVSALVGFLMNQKKNPELRLTRENFRINRGGLSGIISVGFPSTIMASIGSVMNVGMNAILSGFAQSNAALNVMSVYFKLQSFVFMPVFGLSNGIIAIIAYNYGARIRERVYGCIKVALTWAITIMLIGTLIFMLFPGQLMAIFESEAEAEITAQMTDIGVVAMRIISSSFLFAAIGITLSTVFQAVGRGVYSMIMSISRQLVILLPVAWLIARLTGDVKAVWWCFPISEAVSLCICLYFYRKCDRLMLSKI